MVFLHKFKYNDETIKYFKLPCNLFYKAVESRTRSLKLQSIDGLFESRKFGKVKGSNIVKCVQKKYFII